MLMMMIPMVSLVQYPLPMFPLVPMITIYPLIPHVPVIIERPSIVPFSFFRRPVPIPVP